MKHKTAELEGALLDAAVAEADGVGVVLREWGYAETCPSCDEEAAPRMDEYDWETRTGWTSYSPSTDWAKGGPIIHRERIAIWAAGNGWRAIHSEHSGSGYYHADNGIIDVGYFGGSDGSTALIAAMRAYVISKLGEEIELP